MASDGWLYLLALREPWQDLAAFLGLEQFLFDDAFDGKQPPWATMEPAFNDAVAGKSKYQWFAEAADLGWTFAPVEDPFAIAASLQVAARGGMSGAKHDNLECGEIQTPPLPWVCDD
jgi:crotonobetainyl-CoA:carnitine CoA-transferase CaiB-like acyl-CoA transferase